MSHTPRVRALFLLLAGGCCVAMAGCSNPARDRMIGKWEANFEMTEDDMANMPSNDNPIVAGIGKLLMKTIRAEIQWEFAADDTVIASATLLGNTVTRRGAWQFVSAADNSTKVQITFDNEEPHDVSFTFSDPDTFEATPMASGKWQWKRVVKFKRVVPTP